MKRRESGAPAEGPAAGPVWAAAAAAAAFAAFLPALRGAFVSWDDKTFLVDNPHWRGLGFDELRWMFTTFTSAHYQPLTWASFGLDFAVWGMDPFGYHLTNVLLHAAAAALFYGVCLRFLASTAAPDEPPRAAALGALFAALVFAVHPLRAESVAWVSERRDVLSGALYLGAALAYLLAREAGSAAARARRLAASWLLFVASLLAKIMGVTFPLALVILDVYPLRRLPGDPRRWAERAYRAVWLEKAAFLIPALALGIVNLWGQSANEGVASLDERSPAQRLASAAFGLCFYLWKTFAPAGLSPLYEVPRPFDPLAPVFLASGAAALALGALLWRARRRFPAAAAAGAYYVLTAAPVLGLVQTGPQIAADRYTYLPCLGWAALAGGALRSCLRGSPGARRAALAALVLIPGALGPLAARQSRAWRDSRTLWEHALRVDPRNAAALASLGVLAYEEGRVEEAIALYRRSLDANPAGVDALIRLGEALESRRQPGPAADAYRRALAVRPAHAEAHYRLGKLLEDLGEGSAAREHLQRAFERDPLFRLAGARPPGSVDPAAEARLERLRERLRRAPGDGRAENDLGNALVALGRPREALRHFRGAARLLPGEPAVRFNLGNAHALLGELDAAARAYEEALRLDPGFAPARQNLVSVRAALDARR